MRRLLGILAVTILVAACTPGQMATIHHKERRIATTVRVQSVKKASARKVSEAPSPFLTLIYALHENPFLVCTRAHESDTAGGYRAYNGDGPWYGAYQFTQGTWDNSANRAGFPEYAGQNILDIPSYIQDAVAWSLYQWQGTGPWGGRCRP